MPKAISRRDALEQIVRGGAMLAGAPLTARKHDRPTSTSNPSADRPRLILWYTFHKDNGDNVIDLSGNKNHGKAAYCRLVDLPAIRDDRLKLGDGRPELGDGRPGIGDGKPGLGDGRPTLGSGKPGLGDGKPDLGNGKPALGEGRPGLGDGKPAVGDVRLALGDGKADLGDGRPDLGDGRPGLGDGKPGLRSRESNKARIFDGRRSFIEIGASKTLDLTGVPLTVEAWIKAESPDGTILARKGERQGFALHLKSGKPVFVLIVDGRTHTVRGTETIGTGWVYLAGVLSKKAGLALFVNGKLVGSEAGGRFLSRDPNETARIGWDGRSKVGDYSRPPRFRGFIDEIRLYRGALSSQQIKEHASRSLRNG